METQIVLNNFPKYNFSVTTIVICLKNYLYTNLLVAMVTEFNSLGYCMILLSWKPQLS